MDKTPRVSVIIPAYNHEGFVGQAIESVLQQTYPDFELLISDDCSTDHSRQVIAAYADPRIRTFYQEKNLGPVYAIQFLQRQSRGEYIALLNSDDYWAPRKLELQVALMDRLTDVDACFTHGTIVDADSRPLTELDVPYANIFIQPNRTRAQWLRYLWDRGNALAHMSILIRRDLYAKEFPQNPALRQLPDYELWLRLIQKKRIHVLQEPLFYHRRTTGENRNTSAETADNAARSLNEENWAVYSLITRISDELLVEGFSDLFRRPEARGAMELSCERYFLLLQHPRLGKHMSYPCQYFWEHSMDPAFVTCMQETYSYTLTRFFALSGLPGEEALPDEAAGPSKASLAAENAELREQNAELARQLELFRSSFQEMQNSNCWKLTKPIRQTMTLIKRLKRGK